MTKTANNLHDYGLWYFARWIQVFDQVGQAALIYLVWERDDIDKPVQGRGLQSILICFGTDIIHRGGDLDRSLLHRSFGGCQSNRELLQRAGILPIRAYRWESTPTIF